MRHSGAARREDLLLPREPVGPADPGLALPSYLVRGLRRERRHLPRCAVLVDRDEDEVRRGDVHGLGAGAVPRLGLDADADVAFIVNDSMTLAKRLAADGVHLGQSDGDIPEARALLGPSAQIGKTCHESRHLAMEAGAAGADCVGSPSRWAFAARRTHRTFQALREVFSDRTSGDGPGGLGVVGRGCIPIETVDPSW